ncbi:hypothetical protein CRE_30943 [Caenorhabditis remanei]|uniref:Uncharacterized protein n=1 Tax=Caenorhabditis remanei TaxID=31234 RepID=E3LTP3_CAERE|nr:hypothetical protein CRE_30943 [Caenorhabditis remanei]
MRHLLIISILQWSPLLSGAAVFIGGRGVNSKEQAALRIARAGGGVFGGAAGYDTRGISTFSFRHTYGERGIKVGSSRRSSSFGTEAFLYNVYNTSFNTPVRFDNREYFWNVTQARKSINWKVFCEYQVGKDDGELQTTAFLDGTLVKSIYFGCAGTSVDCCGMYCCHVMEDYLMLILFCVMIGGGLWMLYATLKIHVNKSRVGN